MQTIFDLSYARGYRPVEILDPTNPAKLSNLTAGTSQIGLVLSSFREWGSLLEYHRRKFIQEYDEYKKSDPSKAFRYSEPNPFLSILP
jgi:hypothetical protein